MTSNAFIMLVYDRSFNWFSKFMSSRSTGQVSNAFIMLVYNFSSNGFKFLDVTIDWTGIRSFTVTVQGVAAFLIASILCQP